mmetsp:Transcript_5558/g.16524  ORF Transcript_5558/g.16524 Transcript_5558/m.16524 type:complete len:328 (-) Transcript_5558:1326-2309(-)
MVRVQRDAVLERCDGLGPLLLPVPSQRQALRVPRRRRLARRRRASPLLLFGLGFGGAKLAFRLRGPRFGRAELLPRVGRGRGLALSFLLFGRARGLGLAPPLLCDDLVAGSRLHASLEASQQGVNRMRPPVDLLYSVERHLKLADHARRHVFKVKVDAPPARRLGLAEAVFHANHLEITAELRELSYAFMQRRHARKQRRRPLDVDNAAHVAVVFATRLLDAARPRLCVGRHVRAARPRHDGSKLVVKIIAHALREALKLFDGLARLRLPRSLRALLRERRAQFQHLAAARIARVILPRLVVRVGVTPLRLGEPRSKRVEVPLVRTE